ncbi:hypothetical protein [Phaeobacter sp. HF9A]|uniref:hypothetical protein n=1 Tax=Phaeobacter sp. HF9A TaxID=2721561 RepID=UPI0020CA92D4|nr:hypothetical protein [Phaeobacter sp. HF9A]
MRKFAAFLFLALIGQAPPASASPWLEAHRHGFLSTSGRARGSGQEFSAYGAYGLTPRLSLGFDIHQSTDAGFRSAHALAFARLPLRQSDRGWQLAAEVMVGTTQSAGQL